MRPFGVLRVDRLHDPVDVGAVLAFDLEAGLCLVDQQERASIAEPILIRQRKSIFDRTAVAGLVGSTEA